MTECALMSRMTPGLNGHLTQLAPVRGHRPRPCGILLGICQESVVPMGMEPLDASCVP